MTFNNENDYQEMLASRERQGKEYRPHQKKVLLSDWRNAENVDMYMNARVCMYSPHERLPPTFKRVPRNVTIVCLFV